MKFSSDEIASVLQQEIENFDSKIDVREVGTVLEVGDGIARVYGSVRRDGRRNGRVSQRLRSDSRSTWKKTASGS